MFIWRPLAPSASCSNMGFQMRLCLDSGTSAAFISRLLFASSARWGQVSGEDRHRQILGHLRRCMAAWGHWLHGARLFLGSGGVYSPRASSSLPAYKVRPFRI